jgi:hypothetical protein
MVEKTYGLNLEARTERFGIAGLWSLKHTHPKQGPKINIIIYYIKNVDAFAFLMSGLRLLRENYTRDWLLVSISIDTNQEVSTYCR